MIDGKNAVEDPARRLLELEAVKQLKARYCLLLDTKQWEAWSRLLTEDFTIEGTTNPPATTRDEFVAGVREAFEGVQSAHHVHSPIIELADDGTARGLWAMSDDLRLPAGHRLGNGYPRRLGYGHYEEEYRKEGDVWRISFMRLARLFVWWQQDGIPAEGGVASAGTEWLEQRRV